MTALATRSAFTWARPRTLTDALTALAQDPAAIPFAGGTDLMVSLAFGTLPAGRVVDLSVLDQLRGITVTPAETLVGALTTYTEIADHPALEERHPLLVAAARVSGAWAIRNRGTLGGNIANASPAADSPPALLAYGARVELASVRGTRWVAYEDFHTGYRQTLRTRDELITRIAIPAPPAGAVHFYRKVGTRKAQAISKVCFAAVASRAGDALGDVRIALGSVAPTVVAATQTAAHLSGRALADIDLAAARALLESEIAPIDDVRSSAWYRRRVAGNLLEQFVADVAGA